MVCQLSKCRFFWLVAVLFLAGTSNGLFGQMLYVGNLGDDTISAYVIDQESGLLTEVLPRVATSGSPSSVAVHPSGKFVYATNFGNPALGANGPSLAAFSINANTGALTLVSSSPLTPGSSPQAVVIDPSLNRRQVLHISKWVERARPLQLHLSRKRISTREPVHTCLSDPDVVKHLRRLSLLPLARWEQIPH